MCPKDSSTKFLKPTWIEGWECSETVEWDGNEVSVGSDMVRVGDVIQIHKQKLKSVCLVWQFKKREQISLKLAESKYPWW